MRLRESIENLYIICLYNVSYFNFFSFIILYFLRTSGLKKIDTINKKKEET